LDEDTGKMLVVKTILRDIGSVDSEKSIANGGEKVVKERLLLEEKEE